MKAKIGPQAQQSDLPIKPLSLQNIENLTWQMQAVQLAIARRAFELFETRGREHGHDWEDWFQAESELLRPVTVAISESEDRLSIRANVFGFEENELKIGIEPRRITILGNKETSVTESEGGKVESIDWYPDRILRLIDLPMDVMPESSVVEVQQGLLKFELPKAAKQKVEAVTSSAA
jgi:HSP20 family molecular chaperone IbpA